MAIDKRLQIYDEQDNLVDYDILASDVKFLPDGKDLPTKLAEMQDEIGEGGYTPPQGGIPKTDLAPSVQTSLDKADSAYQKPASGIPASDIADGVIPDTSNLATKTELANKVDKNGTDSLMTAAEHTKLGNLPTATELATQMNAKANDNAVVKSISVNGGTPQSPVSGNVNISVEGGGSVDSVTVSGTKYTPDVNGDVNLGDLRGQDGNSGVASADGVESINNLNGGTTDTQSKVYVLGANQGKRLRDQIELVYQRIQTLYGLLGNIAFWDGKPAASALLPDLDWGAPKHAVTITNSLSNSVITRNGLDAGSSFQAEEGSTVTLIVAPASGFALTSVSYVKDGGSSTSATSLGDGTYKIEFVMGGSDVAITVSGTAVAAIPITYGTPTHCAVPSGVTNPKSVASGGTVNVQYECGNGYQLSAADITISGATIGTITHSGNVFTIPITHDGTSQSISIAATASAQQFLIKTSVVVSAANHKKCRLGAPDDSRRTLVCLASSINNPLSWWGPDSGLWPDEDDYSLLPIKSGKSTLTIKCNSSYIFGTCLIKQGEILTPIAWENAGVTKVFDLTQYPTATHFNINIKNTGNTTIADSVTMEDMGLEIEFS